MYPKELFVGLHLYEIFITIGLVACMLLLRWLSDKCGFSAKWQNFVLITMIAAVVVGYGAAIGFQALYNYQATGEWIVKGQTFLGGLIGGAAAYLLIYFGIGLLLFRDNEHLRNFPDLLSMASCGITAAHGFGRLGCLMAGCCHGAETDAWYGILMGTGVNRVRYVPVQLYEAIFLSLLCACLVARFLRGKRCCMPLYMIAYGIWRFFIEYLRDDYRGASPVSFLTPSQFISIILLIGGLILLIVEATLRQTARLRQAGAIAETGGAEATGEAEETADTDSTAAAPAEPTPRSAEFPADTTADATVAAATDTPAEEIPAVPPYGILDAVGIAAAPAVTEEDFIRADRFKTADGFIKADSFRRVPTADTPVRKDRRS